MMWCTGTLDLLGRAGDRFRRVVLLTGPAPTVGSSAPMGDVAHKFGRGAQHLSLMGSLHRCLRWAVLLVALVLVASACSGSTEAEVGSSGATGARAVPSPPLLSIVQDEGRDVVATADGFSLYIFDGDRPNVSACLDTCSQTFIPFTMPEGQFSAGEGLDPAKVETFERPDGIEQLSYAGRPLYRFSADANPGDSQGEGSAGRWYHLAPEGIRVPRN